MSAVSANPPVVDGKNAKRKKTRGGDSIADIIVPKSDDAPDLTAVNGAENDSPYVRELQKSARNLRKKLANTEKAQSILNENAGKSLADLLEERKINADQKKQLENKPGVELQLKQTEEQLEHYRKFEEECEKRAAQKFEDGKHAFHKEHEASLAAKEAEHAKALQTVEDGFKSRLLLLSRFLRTAAAKRQTEEKEPESDAIEGVLLQLYGGDMTAVEAMENLIRGDDSLVTTVDGESSQYTFKQIHDIVVKTAEAMEAVATTSTETVAETDPTIANAGLTEIEDASEPAVSASIVNVVPDSATVHAEAANATANNLTSSQDLTASGTSDAWVEVRNPDETDTGLSATPAAITNQESWAEDVPVETAIVQTPAGDGFSEVRHGRGDRGRGGRGRGGGGRGRGEGYRGRGRGGGFRGDGEYRGRGRGRGGYRGRGGQGVGDANPAPAKAQS